MEPDGISANTLPWRKCVLLVLPSTPQGLLNYLRQHIVPADPVSRGPKQNPRSCGLSCPLRLLQPQSGLLCPPLSLTSPPGPAGPTSRTSRTSRTRPFLSSLAATSSPSYHSSFEFRQRLASYLPPASTLDALLMVHSPPLSQREFLF